MKEVDILDLFWICFLFSFPSAHSHHLDSSLCLQSLSYATTLMGVCSHLLRPLKTAWSKQTRKKKAQNPPQVTHLPDSVEMVFLLCNVVN